MKDVITIDGPSAAGKGTVSKILARRLGYKYLDTGALYRAVAWKVKKTGVDPADEAAVAGMLKDINITFSNDRVLVDGTDVTPEIRTAEIGELSSRVSAMPAVREKLLALQRQICRQGRVVIEGRDTGTVVFPEAGNKFFLDAAIEERARRRYEELKSSEPGITMEKTIEDIRKRDLRDSSRKVSPLKKTPDMVYIDSTGLTIEEVVERIMDRLNNKNEAVL